MKRPLVAFVAVALATALLLVGARADEGDVVRRIPLPARVPDAVDFYGVYQGRQKVGWGLLEIRREGEGAAARYVSRTWVEATLEGMGTQLEFEFYARDVFRGTPPYELLSSRERRVEADERVLALDRVGSGYRARIRDGDVTTTEMLPDIRYTLADRMSHIHWAQGGLEVGDRLRVREFDITALRHEIFEYEVLSVDEGMAHGTRVRTYDVSMRSDRAGRLGSFRMDTQGRTFRSPFAAVAELRLEPRDQALRRELASEVLAFGHAPATEALGDPASISTLVVGVYGGGTAALESGPRQRVWREEDTGDVLVLLGAEATGDDVVTDADRHAATGASATYPADAPAVRARAAQATSSAAGRPRAEVEALVHFVHRHLADIHLPDPVPVEQLLERPLGDADDHARLFVTLARARGLAAREVVGLVYLGDEEEAFGRHVWAEVALDGRWTPVDPAWGQTEIDATHVRLGLRNREERARIALADRWAFEVRSVVRDR